MTPTQVINSSRTRHAYPGALYLLPSDEEERARLSVQHQLFTRLLSDRLILPIASFSKKDEILEIGTGAGVWLCDARTRLPESVQLYGIDIEARLFPNYTALSPNVHLSVCSGTDLPSYWTDKFTLIHQRLLICAYTRAQWQRGISEMWRVLAPGGYIQLTEVGPEWLSGPKTAAHVLRMDSFFAGRDMLLRCGAYLGDMLEAAGFVDITVKEVAMNLGQWAGEDGIQGRDTTIGAWRGMRDPMIKAGLFASVEEFDETLNDVEEEWEKIEGSHQIVRVFCGRKPLDGTTAACPHGQN